MLAWKLGLQGTGKAAAAACWTQVSRVTVQGSLLVNRVSDLNARKSWAAKH